MTIYKGEIFQLVAIVQNSRIELAQVAVPEGQISRQTTFAETVFEGIDADHQQSVVDRVVMVAFEIDAADLIGRQEVVWDVTENRLFDANDVESDYETV